MSQIIGILLVLGIVAFCCYQMGWGGGKRENGREGNGPLGGMPFW